MIQKTNLFAAPKTQQELFDWIDKLSDPGEKKIAVVIFGMTWNLCSHLMQENMNKKEAEAAKEEV
jgi:hypothetical protein